MIPPVVAVEGQPSPLRHDLHLLHMTPVRGTIIMILIVILITILLLLLILQLGQQSIKRILNNTLCVLITFIISKKTMANVSKNGTHQA